LPVFSINPLTDPRWSELVHHHRSASVFHSSGWLSALQRTYGYEPVAFTSCQPDEPLRNALVCCTVKSWITGRRLVSLPFSDHCDVLVDSARELEELLGYLSERITHDHFAHAEIRPTSADWNPQLKAQALRPYETFCLHRLSLEAPLDLLFRNLHRNCIQRKIWRAEKEMLVYQNGCSEALLHDFYSLVLRTRRRQCLPPQPLFWFRNLVASMGDNLTIRLVSKDQHPVAAMLTLSHGTTVTYKYGCSDERFHALGGIPFLFWKTIQEAKDEEMRQLDLGRSELTQPGLVVFKDRLGAVRTELTYWRCAVSKPRDAGRCAWQRLVAKGIFSCVPDPVFAASGSFLYRHLG